MKKLPFYKMHGTGNDFIILKEEDILNLSIVLDKNFIQKICHRNFGIGSDGLIIISKSEIADFKYNMYNPDGSQAEMCGNGIRCYMKYLLINNLTIKSKIKVETLIGILEVEFRDNLFIVNMGAPSIIKELQLGKMKLGDEFSLNSSGKEFSFIPVSMGNPHAVIFLKKEENLENFLLEKYGKPIENNTLIFPNRVNVEFIKIENEKTINMRVWERGAGETLACGTGACASVVAGILLGFLTKNEFIKVNLKGGELYVKWSGYENDPVIMKGDALVTFFGNYII